MIPPVRKGCLGVRPRGEIFSGTRACAKDQLEAVRHPENFDVVDRVGFVYWWLLQRFSWRRSGLHPDASHGLSSWDSHPYRCRHRSLRDHHFGRLWIHPARHEWECGHSGRFSDAYRGGSWRPTRGPIDPVFQRTVDSPGIRSVAYVGCGYGRDCPAYRPPFVTMLAETPRGIIAAKSFLRLFAAILFCLGFNENTPLL